MLSACGGLSLSLSLLLARSSRQSLRPTRFHWLAQFSLLLIFGMASRPLTESSARHLFNSPTRMLVVDAAGNPVKEGNWLPFKWDVTSRVVCHGRFFYQLMFTCMCMSPCLWLGFVESQSCDICVLCQFGGFQLEVILEHVVATQPVHRFEDRWCHVARAMMRNDLCRVLKLLLFFCNPCAIQQYSNS